MASIFFYPLSLMVKVNILLHLYIHADEFKHLGVYFDYFVEELKKK